VIKPWRVGYSTRPITGGTTLALAEALGEAELESALARSPVGKVLPGALYVHRSAVGQLAPVIRRRIAVASRIWPEASTAEIVKVGRRSGNVSFLRYPDFDSDAHPALTTAVTVNVATGTVRRREYATNPPILHRKETFVAPGYPGRGRFTTLTRAEEAAGLLSDTARIGHCRQWESRLADRDLRVSGHHLRHVASPAQPASRAPSAAELARNSGRTAIARLQPSRPAAALLETIHRAVLARPSDEAGDIIDVGSGRGADVAFFRGHGLDADGYDPSPEFGSDSRPQRLYRVATATYVLNVLPTRAARAAVLRDVASYLVEGGMAVITARSPEAIEHEAARHGWSRWGDGYLSNRAPATFQKGLSRAEVIRLARRAGLVPLTDATVRRIDGATVVVFTKQAD
jgi:hypothetical protein